MNFPQSYGCYDHDDDSTVVTTMTTDSRAIYPKDKAVLANPPQKCFESDDDSTVMTAQTAESSVNLLESTGSKLRKNRRLVRFAKVKQCVPIPHLDDMSEEEVCRIWYVDTDFDAMKNKISPLVKKITMGIDIESRTETARGLEKRTKSGSYLRRKNRSLAMKATLAEQQRQRDENDADPDLLAVIYHQASSPCQDDAFALALKDQAAVQWDLVKTRRKFEQPSTQLRPSTSLCTVSSIETRLDSLSVC